MRTVTLTFDNGPTPDTTPLVHDVLAERGIPALFFVVGARLAHPLARPLLERARAEGHVVGNHSMYHRVPLGEDTSADAVEREIVATQDALGELAGVERLFRPFGRGGLIGSHLFSQRALDHLRAGGYTVVLWNSVPHDWDDPEGWPARARADIEAHDHTVVVLHDLPTGAMRALPSFLDDLLEDGVTFTSDLPDSCVPVRRGALAWPVDHLVGVP
jgi:peptidoglycan/xylan/chitin deacetylase (PgdA/CDA1 family)